MTGNQLTFGATRYLVVGEKAGLLLVEVTTGKRTRKRTFTRRHWEALSRLAD